MTDERIEEIIKVTWSRDDVSLSFEEKYKRKPTEQELDDCIDKGWEYIDNAICERKEKEGI